MSLLAIPFPAIEPVAFSLGPLPIRWYALAYVAGFLFGVRYAEMLTRRPRLFGNGDGAPKAGHPEAGILWLGAGVILGGRIGYALFYQAGHYWEHPAELVKIWRGGMSFHGGLIGVLAGALLFARRNGIRPLRLGDVLACVAPIGLFFGRIANFVNAELWGRESDMPWAVVFPMDAAERLARHPSQLYEALTEGLALFCLLGWCAWRKGALAREGLCTGLFLAGYALSRIAVERFREPDAHLGFLVSLGDGGVTMGQLLTLPMFVAGLWLVFRAYANGTRSA